MTDPTTRDDERVAPEPVRTDMLDYPTAWRIANELTDTAEHHPKCSSLVSSGFLCDCAAVPVEWARRCIEQEPEREAEFRERLNDYLPEHMRTARPGRQVPQ